MLVFINESGDLGVRSSFRYFVMALVIFKDFEQAQQLQLSIKNLLCKSGKMEFKFSQSKPKERVQFFALLDKYDYEITAIIVDKHAIYNPILRERPKLFYNFFLKKILQASDLDNAKIRLDGKASRSIVKSLDTYLRLRTGGMVTSFQMKDSQSDVLIQTADMIAGAIHRSSHPNKARQDDWYKLIEPKIRCLLRFP